MTTRKTPSTFPIEYLCLQSLFYFKVSDKPTDTEPIADTAVNVDEVVQKYLEPEFKCLAMADENKMHNVSINVIISHCIIPLQRHPL